MADLPLEGAIAGGVVSVVGWLLSRLIGTTDKQVEALKETVSELEKELVALKTAMAVSNEKHHALSEKLDMLLDGMVQLRKSVDRALARRFEESDDGRNR